MKESRETSTWLPSRIHWLHVCRGVRPPPQRVSKLWHYTIWWWVARNAGIWGMQITSSLPFLPGPPRPGVVAPNRVLSLGPIELNCVLMLNWIPWRRTVLTFKMRSYAKLSCLKWTCFCMLNWIIWNRTVFDIETVLTLNWIVWNRTVLTFKMHTQTKLNCLKWNCLIY